MQQLARVGSVPSQSVEDALDHDELDHLVPREVVSTTGLDVREDQSSDVRVDENRLRRLVGPMADEDPWPSSARPAVDGRLDSGERVALVCAPGVPDPKHSDTNQARVDHDRVQQGDVDQRGEVPVTFLGRRLKRGIDVAGSLALMAALSPVLATCAAVVRLGSSGPVLFRQKRIGQNGQAFTMLKFRTMYVDSDQSVHETYVKRYIAGDVAQDADGDRVYKLVGDARITPAGHWLRRLSLDELPQLFNVLRGEMSLVGPRPPLPYEVEHYRQRDLQRFRARPGITGLWQVSGRNKTTFDEMIDLDLTYIERWSLVLDLRILQRTIPAVFFPDGH